MRLYLIQFPKNDLNHLLLLVPSDRQKICKKPSYTESVEKYDYNGTVMELKASVKEDEKKIGQAFRDSWKADAHGGRI